MSSPSRRQRRTSRRSTNEFLGIIVSCIGAYAMLFGLLPQLASGTLGLFLLGGALLGAVLHVALGPRQGKSIVRALLEVLGVAAATFAPKPYNTGCSNSFTARVSA